MPFILRIRALMTGAGTAEISKAAEKIQKDKRYKKVTGIKMIMSLKKKIQGRISKMPSGAYNACYIILFLALLICTAMVPYAGRAVRYTGYTCRQSDGIIEDRQGDIYTFTGNHMRKHSYGKYYFEVNGEWVRVKGSDYQDYDKGDLFSYYVYEKPGKESYGTVERYYTGKGIGILLAEALLIIWNLLFNGADTGSRKKGKAKKAKKTLLDMEKPMEEYTTAELYELCGRYGCYIPPRHKKNRPYIENQIRQEKKEEERRKEEKKESKKSNGVFKVIAWLALIGLFLTYAAAVGAGLYGYL